jgi:hypothetical protein
MKIVTVPGQTYVVYAAEGATITAPGVKDPLLTCEGGKPNYVTVPGGEMEISDPEATYAACRNFKNALAALGLLGGGNSGLPAGYTRVEFLESTGTQYIDIESEIKYSCSVKCDAQYTTPTYFHQLWGWQDSGRYLGPWMTSSGSGGFMYNTESKNAEMKVANKRMLYTFDGKNARAGLGNAYLNFIKAADIELGFASAIFCGKTRNGATWMSSARIFSFEIAENDEAIRLQYIPALDSTGTPCMYDLVTRKPFYNSGTGDFLYPGKETTATTYSLRRRMYAQMTEHGIRRLYHVPTGCTLTPEEYAAENGFKLLVETPAPEEGYWAPQWHEREDCIELEWVETEPPADEELLTIEA